MKTADSILHCDVLIIGSGVAGLSAALKLGKAGLKVLIITKKSREESNSWHAQGGVAAVLDNLQDSIEKHVQDTLQAGAGLCYEPTVRKIIEEGPSAIQELIELGTPFDQTEEGTLDLGKEGGHSASRIIHSQDQTGKAIVSTLLKAIQTNPNIQIREGFYAIELISQHHFGYDVERIRHQITCYGAYVYNSHSRQVIPVLARTTILATGGVGQVYQITTNPSIATGDGIAMAHRARARIANMEFIQFHPTALYKPGLSPAFLITEALRGAGAHLLSAYHQRRFMLDYDSRGELAPRDIVARAIDQEQKKSGIPYVWLDARHIPKEKLLTHFPHIYQKCLEFGYDLSKDLIPVTPAAHYLCGGILVDLYGRSSIQHLFAIGEVACTGLHGANRLASNSLLEALVMAKFCSQYITETIDQIKDPPIPPPWNDQGTMNPEEWILISHNRSELQSIMTNYVGIVRSRLRLKRALRRIQLLWKETEAYYKRTKISPELCELRNLILCGYLITKSALLREETRGLHYRTDFPNPLPLPTQTIL